MSEPEANGGNVSTLPAADRIAYDRVTWGSHCGNCIANCAYRVFTRDGHVIWEEQSGDLPGAPGVPDMNPLGCQKGAAWHTQITAGDRLLHPLRRVGDRGSGQWERVSWDDALTEVADAIIDALEEQGSHSVMIDEGAEGGVLTAMGKARLSGALGCITMDGNSTVSDVHLGHWLTFGNLLAGSSADDTFRADTVLVWNANPAFTRIPYFHYLPEARYRGATIVHIGPDYSPSAMHADWFVPVVPGSDAALGLALARTILDLGLADLDFVRSQTDLPLLVRLDTGRFLRESDMQEGGRDDRFFAWLDGAPVPVDAARLDDPANPAPVVLDGHFETELLDGSRVVVAPVMDLIRDRLAAYSPEAVADVCGVPADTIRSLARVIATGRTKLYNGLGSCKHHHGDLMERSMGLVLALTGNWGKPGTGLDTYIIALLEGEVLGLLKGRAGIEAGETTISAVDAFLDGLKQTDPSMTEGRAVLSMMRAAAAGMTTTPPAFFLYDQCGFSEIWDDPAYGDSPRPFAEYVKEAKTRGWWGGLVRPGPDVVPRVVIQAGTNTLRRTRGGQRQMLRTVWPDLSMVVLIDWRMNTVGMVADVVLPVACEAEHITFHGANSHSWERMFSDQAVEPAGEARSDWQIFRGLAETISRRAAERGLDPFADGRGGRRQYAEIGTFFTMDGAICDDEAALDEVIRDSALSGNLAAGTSVASLRRTGWVRPERLPRAMAAVTGSRIDPEGPFVAYRQHVEDGVPFPTLTGRAQFYIDHPWFLEADEHLPRHKPVPMMGGDYPLQVTGGHPRWSIHATNTTNPYLLETTRGHPVLHMSPADASTRGIGDDDLVRLFNDHGELRVNAKVSPAVRPGQVILYASWEPYLYREWHDITSVEPGMVKWLHFAGGYGHLGYSALQWQPVQSDRLYRVEAELAPAEASR